jgi:hypothetical protein
MSTIPVVVTMTDSATGIDAETKSWTLAAARGEVPWVCADCGASFSGGMPDQCVYGHQSCTDIIQRDKREAKEQP